jgi:hypothetical protein
MESSAMNLLSSWGWPAIAAGLMAIVVLGLLVWFATQGAKPVVNLGKQRPFRMEDWQPRTMRPLTPTELHTLKYLRKALPECLLMPQVALARFLNVTQNRSYNQWFGSVGRRCVDFLVCSEQGDVLGVIQLHSSTGKNKPATEGSQRKIKALEMARIPVWLLAKDDLPDTQALRAMVMPELQASAEHSQLHPDIEGPVWQPTRFEQSRPTSTFEPMLSPAQSAKAKLPSERWDQAWPVEEARSSEFLDEFGMIEVPPLATTGSGRTATGFTR